MIKELCQRMGKCEDAIMAKETDVASVKYNLEVLKKCFHEKEEEVGLLKESNLKIEEEMKMMKEKYQEFNHQLEIKIEDLVVKNQLLEKNVKPIENQLLVSKKQLEDQQVEITSVKQEVEDVRSNLSENIKFHLSKPLNDFQSSTNNEVKKLKDQVNNINIQIRASRSYLDKSLNKTNNEINKLSVQITTVDEKLKDNFITLNDKINKDVDVRCNLNENVKFYLNKPLNDFQFATNDNVKKLKDEVNNTNNQIEEIRSFLDKKTDEFHNLSSKIDATENVIKDNFSTLNEKINNGAEDVNLINDQQKEIANLKHHVNNIENILFCGSSGGSKYVLLQWKLQNYQYHFDVGKRVYSPIFLTQINGYCFKLFVEWNGEKKENLGLFLQVCHGSNYDKPLEPFKIPYTLEMVDNNGNILSQKITLSDIEANRDEAFTLLPQRNECKRGLGLYVMLRMPDLNNYILNDMLSIQCRLTPS